MDDGLLAFGVDWVEDAIRFLIRVFVEMLAGDFAFLLFVLLAGSAAFMAWRKFKRRD